MNLVTDDGTIFTDGVRLGECKLLWQAVEKHDKELKERQENAGMRMTGRDTLQGNRIAGDISMHRSVGILFMKLTYNSPQRQR